MRIPFPLVPTEYKNLPQGVIGTTDDFLRIFFTLRVTPLSVFSAIAAGKVGMDGLMKWKLPSNPQLSPSTSFLRVHVHLLLNLQIIRTEIPTSANNIPLPHNAT